MSFDAHSPSPSSARRWLDAISEKIISFSSVSSHLQASANARSIIATKCRSSALAWNMLRRLPMRDPEAVVEQVEFRDSFGWHLEPHPAIRPLMLTGCRESGFLKLRWEDIDLAVIELRLADCKTNPCVVALSRAAAGGACGAAARYRRSPGDAGAQAGRATGSRRKRLGSGWCISSAHWPAALSSEQSCGSPHEGFPRARAPMCAAGLRRHSHGWRIGAFATAPPDDKCGSGCTVDVSAHATAR